jgi:AcrR family transcriptional regulator
VVTERGIDTMSLAELAEALGCSTYTLTYHFGRKDRLLAAIVEHVETKMRAEIERLAAEPDVSLGDLLRRYWQTLREPGVHAYLRLWLEMLVLRSRHPDRFPGFAERAAGGWRTLAADVLRAHRLQRARHPARRRRHRPGAGPHARSRLARAGPGDGAPGPIPRRGPEGSVALMAYEQLR